MPDFQRDGAPVPTPVFAQMGAGIAIALLLNATAVAVLVGSYLAIAGIQEAMGPAWHEGASRPIIEGLIMVQIAWAITFPAAQVVYILPAAVLADRAGRRSMALGILAGAALTVALEGACIGVTLVLPR